MTGQQGSGTSGQTGTVGRERKVPVWMAVTGSLVAIISAVVGIYFTVWPRTQERPLDAWAREATAVCEQYRGELVAGYRDATDRIEAAFSEGTGVAPAVAALDDASNVYRGMVGRIRAIAPPTDSGDLAKVDAALAATERLDAAWATAATLLEQVDPATASMRQLQGIVDAVDVAATVADETSAAFVSAGARSCSIN